MGAVKTGTLKGPRGPKETTMAPVGGVGESKRFIAPDDDLAVAEQRRSVAEKLAGCHVDGEPIEEWVKIMPENIVARMSYPLTDEGLAAQAKIARDRDMRLPTGGTATTPDEKLIVKLRDQRSSDDLLLGTDDPLQVTMDKHLPKGRRGLWIGRTKAGQDGLLRGRLEYEPLLVDDGKGNMVRVEQGGMFLASVSEEAAQAQERFYAGINEANQVSATQRVMEQADRVMQGEGLVDLARRKRVLDDIAGPQNDNPESADAELASLMMEHEAV